MPASNMCGLFGCNLGITQIRLERALKFKTPFDASRFPQPTA